MSYDTTLGAMKSPASRLSIITAGYKEFGRPIDINWAFEPGCLEAASEVSKELHLIEAVPKLCTLVTTSAFDAAIHGVFGRMHGVNCYHRYGPELMNHDLSYYAGPEYKGEYPSKYIPREPNQASHCITWYQEAVK